MFVDKTSIGGCWRFRLAGMSQRSPPFRSSPRRLKARIVSVGSMREHPQEKAWMLDDAAQWELLFQGEEAFGDQLNLYV